MLPIGFVNAAALGLLGLIPVILVLHMLRSRRPPRVISSTMLWRQVSQERVGKLALRPPVVSLSLLLQLLVILLLTIAISTPGILARGKPRHVFLVLDGTTSMLATDTPTGATRFDVAKAQALQALHDLPPSDLVSAILVNSRVQFVGEAESRERTAEQINGLVAGGSGGTLRTVFDLVEAETRGKANAEALLFTDGGLDTSGLRPFAGTVQVSKIGQESRNQAVTQLSVRPSPNTTNAFEAFVRVTNFWDQAVDLPIRSFADSVVFDRRVVRVPARGHVEMVLKIPTGAKLIESRIEDRDVLAADNYAAALVTRSDAIKTVLVSDSPLFLERALQAIPNVQLKSVRPAEYRPTADTQLTVFDGFVPDNLPGTELLFVNPRYGPNPGADGPVSGPGEDLQIPVPIRWDRAHQLLAGVDVPSMIVGRARRLDLPEWATPIVEAPDGPLVYEGDWEGHDVVVFSFDPMSSDLPLRISYPVLLANTVNWLAAGGTPAAVTSGTEVWIAPVLGTREVTVRRPDGSTITLPSTGNPVALRSTEQPGRYLITHRLGTRELAKQTLVVNAGSDTESDIQPKDIQIPSVESPKTLAIENTTRLVPQNNLWVLLLAGAIGVLMLEWWGNRRWA